jgi:DNA-binding CsgD family transcriptional regulator
MPAALLDADGVVRWQNRASKELRGDVVGSPFARLVGAEDLEEYQGLLTRILCRGQPAEFTLDVLDAGGQFVPTQVSSSPVKDGGSVVGIFGVGHPLDRSSEARRVSLGAGSGLTERQHEVLELLAEGRSTEEIAAALALSPTTVRNYIARILATLGVHTRLQAVVVAKRRGLA